MRQIFRLSALVAACAFIAGCGDTVSQGGGSAGPSTRGPTGGPAVSSAPPLPEIRPAATPLPTMGADGTQQFEVPRSGRAVLQQVVSAQVHDTILGARVSNGWRTAAGAQANPDDYAACVAVQTSGSVRYIMAVISGNRTSGLVTGAQGQQRCGDPKRVVQWDAFEETVASAN